MQAQLCRASGSGDDHRNDIAKTAKKPKHDIGDNPPHSRLRRRLSTGDIALRKFCIDLRCIDYRDYSANQAAEYGRENRGNHVVRDGWSTICVKALPRDWNAALGADNRFVVDFSTAF